MFDLVNMFKSFFNLIISIVNLFLDTIRSVIQLILMIPSYVNYVSDVINILPMWLTVFALGILTITVIWAIRRAI